MRLKTNTPQTQQTPPTSYSTVTAPATTPTTMTVAQTTPTQQAIVTPPQINPRRRFSSLAIRGTLWATFLVPLVIIGTQLPQAVFENRPEVRMLLPVAYGQTGSSVVYSPDGKLVALVDARHDSPEKGISAGVTFWNPVTRQRVGKRAEFFGMPQKIAFSADNRELILISPLATRAVNVATGTIRPLEWSYRSVSADGTTAAIGRSVGDNFSRQFQTLDLKTRKWEAYNIPEATLDAQRYSYMINEGEPLVALSPKADLGALVQTVDTREPIHGGLWKKVVLHVWRRGMADPLWTKTLTSAGKLAFSPDGKYLLVSVKEATGENLVCLDVSSGATVWTRPLVPPELARMPFPQPSPVFAISPDSQHVVLRLRSGIRVLRLSNAAMVTHLSRPPVMGNLMRPNPLSDMVAEGALSFSPDGKTLAERLPEGVYLWNLVGVP